MSLMFRQSKEYDLTFQSQISDTVSNRRKYIFRPPFGVDDHFQTLAMFKANRQKPLGHTKLPRLSEKKRITAIEYELNPHMKTMYQYQFNDTADVRLGRCDNRSVECRNKDFRSCQRRGIVAIELCKLSLPELPPRKFRSDRSKRVTEYAAEINYVGSKIISNRIHDHSTCGRLAKHCVHYIEF